METLFIILLSVCISVLVAELFTFIGKVIVFIGYLVAKQDVHVNFKGNIAIIAISSFIIAFLLLTL